MTMNKNSEKFETNETPSTSTTPQSSQHQSIVNPSPLTSIPESILKMTEAASKIGAPQQKLLKTIEPIVASTRYIEKLTAPINFDTFNALDASLRSLDYLRERLTNNAFFGANDIIAKIAQQYASQQNEWLDRISSGICQLSFDFYPSNLEDINSIDLEEIQTVVMLDGIALYELPRKEIAIKFLKASSSSALRDILGSKWKEIAADCRETLKSCRYAKLSQTVEFAINAIDALDSGNFPAAQALVSCLIDTVLRHFFLEIRPQLVPGKANKTSVKFQDFPINQFIALAPIWQAYQSFYPDRGDKIPRTFNRHATTHTVSKWQYCRRNAIQGLMLLCGMIKFIDDDAYCR